MRINIYAHLIIIEILDDIYARAQTWSTVEYYCLFAKAPLVVTQKLPVSTLPKVEYKKTVC